MCLRPLEAWNLYALISVMVEDTVCMTLMMDDHAATAALPRRRSYALCENDATRSFEKATAKAVDLAAIIWGDHHSFFEVAEARCTLATPASAPWSEAEHEPVTSWAINFA